MMENKGKNNKKGLSIEEEIRQHRKELKSIPWLSRNYKMPIEKIIEILGLNTKPTNN